MQRSRSGSASLTRAVCALGVVVGASINHETTYWYDRHVPILFLGAGVQSGVSDAPVYTVDFAPTLAGLAGVIVPDDLDGRRIY